MKSCIFLLVGAILAQPSPAAPGTTTIVERDAHHRKVQTVTEGLNHFFRPVSITNSYMELATSMHFRDEQGNWAESKSLIELFPPDAAVARHGPMQVIFPANARTAGGLDMSVDGKRFRSHVIGIAYAEADTGRAVMVAELQDSIGQLVGDNEVWYPDALVGELRADIQYIYNIHGLQQNIVVRESVDPRAYGLNPATIRVQVFTEWVEAPEPQKQTLILKRTADPARRAQMVDPDLIEERLQFGSVLMPAGSSFPLDEAADPVSTGKTWELRDGNRRVLVEQTDFSDIADHLARLPQAAAVNTRPNDLMARVRPGHVTLPAPPPRQARVQGKVQPVQMAALKSRGKGFVLDWQLLNANTNDFTFRGDTTYLIRSQVTLTGSNVMEAGCVIKYTNYPASTSARLWLSGPLTSLGTAFRPVFLTSMHDDSVGEVIPNSTGNPTTNYAGRTHLYLDYTGAPFNFGHIHMRYAKEGFFLNGSSTLTLTHSTIGNCDRAVANYSSSFTARNILAHNLNTFVYGGSSGTMRGEHLTAHVVKHLLEAHSGGTNTAYLTNSLLISVTNGLFYSGVGVETTLNDTGIFQTAGYGARYLANNSPYRNAGAMNINPALLADLRQRTTHPPLALTGDIALDTTLTPQAQRDTDLIDLGYHYLPADWLVNGISVTNAILRIRGGATVAIDAANTNWGIRLQSGGQLTSEGDPVHLNRFVRTHSFQEIPAGNGASTAPLFADTYPNPATPATVNFRFTDIPQIQQSRAFGQPNANGSFGSVVLRDSQFRGGKTYFSTGVSNTLIACTNLLVEDSTWKLYPYTPSTFHLRNATFKSGALDIYVVAGGTASVLDCAFDYTVVTNWGPGTFDHAHNAFLTNAPLFAAESEDFVFATNTFTFQTGPLGYYYLPTNSPLINLGSVTNAGFVGLWHYTTQTNQTKDAGTHLDVGLHYVALGANNLPSDVEGDSFVDINEDLNGNGNFDSGESDWQSYNTPNGLTVGSELEVYTPLKP